MKDTGNNIPDIKDVDVNRGEENEIDLIELIKRLWQKRVFIIKVTAIFMLIGLMVALFSPKEYTANCVFVPQTGQAKSGGSLSGLAAMAGINLGSIGETEVLSPKVYSKVLENVNYRKDLIYSKFDVEGFEGQVSLIDYFTKEEYKKFSLGGFIMKYTIGLPGLAIKAIRGEKEAVVKENNSDIIRLSKDEFNAFKAIFENISISLDDKNGYITLTVNMPEPLLAAQVAERTFELLQQYITEFKIQKASDKLSFIKTQYSDAQSNYETKQMEYAKFSDANRTITSSVARVKEEQLRNELSLAFSIFSELSSQMIQADLQVKEDTPLLTAVKPVVVPYQKSKPKRATILVVWTFLGGIMGCGLVFGLDFLKKQGSTWPKSWVLAD